MKNLNSFAFIAKAIEYEYKRQVDAIEAGEEVIQETRRYDPTSGKTYQMRSKENANDYRYFPDPDLPGIVLSNDRINEIKSSIPSLPDEESISMYPNTDSVRTTPRLLSANCLSLRFLRKRRSIPDTEKYLPTS